MSFILAMERYDTKSLSRAAAVAAALLLLTVPLQAATGGTFKGLLQDESGQPVRNVLVALLASGTARALPILARTDHAGGVLLENIQAGDYRVVVKSSRYRGPDDLIQILPGRTTFATLILQQLFRLDGAGEENLNVKTLLRRADKRRLIFRGLPAPEGDTGRFGPLFERATLELYTNSGLDGDYLIFPERASGGSTTNFAVSDSFGGAAYILAGQLGSGDNSMWRLKNFVEFSPGRNHDMQVAFGFGRLGMEQPSLTLLNDPSQLGDDTEYTRRPGTTRMTSLGISDRFFMGDAVSVRLGMEMTRVQTDRRRTFFSPSAEVAYSPFDRTRLHFVMTSKRTTQRNNVVLPGGEYVNLGDSVYFSRVGDEFGTGTARYYQGSITQRLTDRNEVEFAVYDTRHRGHTTPVLAIMPSQAPGEVVHLENGQADAEGYRLTVRRRISDNMTASVSYIRGNTTGVSSETAVWFPGQESLHSFLTRRDYQVVATRLEAFIPYSGTRLNAMVKLAPDGQPITTLDALSDTYETGNQGVNLFVRQIVPLPTGLLSVIGLDFLSDYEIEALLDIRNLTNEDLATLTTGEGEVRLFRNPRTVRGGISVRF